MMCEISQKQAEATVSAMMNTQQNRLPTSLEVPPLVPDNVVPVGT